MLIYIYIYIYWEYWGRKSNRQSGGEMDANMCELSCTQLVKMQCSNHSWSGHQHVKLTCSLYVDLLHTMSWLHRVSIIMHTACEGVLFEPLARWPPVCSTHLLSVCSLIAHSVMTAASVNYHAYNLWRHSAWTTREVATSMILSCAFCMFARCTQSCTTVPELPMK